MELARRHLLGAVAGVGHERRVAILRGTREEGGCEQHRAGGWRRAEAELLRVACRRLGAEAGGHKPWCGVARNGAKGTGCAEGWCRRGARAGVRRKVGATGAQRAVGRRLVVGPSSRPGYADASFACKGVAGCTFLVQTLSVAERLAGFGEDSGQLHDRFSLRSFRDRHKTGYQTRREPAACS